MSKAPSRAITRQQTERPEKQGSENTRRQKPFFAECHAPWHPLASHPSPAEEMAGYTEFCNRMVEGYAPVGILETELARSCADMQYRLNRVAASEHNLFAIGHHENGNKRETGHPESHTAMTLAETIRSSDPLKTLSTYESRLHRRFMQTIR